MGISKSLTLLFFAPLALLAVEPAWARDTPDENRWPLRGGFDVSYGFGVQLTAIAIPRTPFVGENPVNGELDIGKRTTYGIGGGLGPHVGVIYRRFPGAKLPDELLFALHADLGLSLNVLYVRPPERFKYQVEGGSVASKRAEFDNRAYAYLLLPLRLGGMIGLGNYRSSELWRGSFLGLSYVPTLISSLEFGKEQDDIVTDVNPAGVEVHLDIGKIHARQKRNTLLRLSGLLLPRVNDDLPWLASLGLGAVWY